MLGCSIEGILVGDFLSLSVLEVFHKRHIFHFVCISLLMCGIMKDNLHGENRQLSSVYQQCCRDFSEMSNITLCLSGL
jgi:hypothetical protein